LCLCRFPRFVQFNRSGKCILVNFFRLLCSVNDQYFMGAPLLGLAKSL